MADAGSTMRIFNPYPGVLVFYDGRIAGKRLHGEGPNWLDDGAYSLGTASYAIIDGGEALVYDAQMTLAHARLIRNHLHQIGCRSMRLVVSHWHTDHVAGNEAFSDCDIIANSRTLKALEANRNSLESDDPPIRPLVLPNQIFEESLALKVGRLDVELRLVNIHSHDETVLLLPEHGLLLAADTLEDSVTYVSEPEYLATHLAELDRMAGFPFRHILPNHGDPDIIAAGGYDRRLIEATKLYVTKLLRLRQERSLAALSFADFAQESFATGGARYFAPYEPVHRQNVEAVLNSTPAEM